MISVAPFGMQAAAVSFRYRNLEILIGDLPDQILKVFNLHDLKELSKKALAGFHHLNGFTPYLLNLSGTLSQVMLV